DITETLSITQTKASRHLGVLRNAGLVDDRKNAQWVYYSLKESNSTKLLHNIINELLRKESLYNDDLNKLYRWLEVKNNKCD
ncbi:MAG: ArsR family transcriptional regulator, partial [Clostridiales bacterium]|nr:ArsR family transcriptional regulator [Clostridiales bacterium]